MKSNNKFFQFVKSFHIIPKLVCILIAFVFWIYVMEVDSPDYEYTFEDVPITIIGTNQLENEMSLSVFSGYDTLIDVTVKGQKTVISKYSSEDIEITVDVSEIQKSGMYSLDLFYDLPSGLTFIESSVSEVNMFIDKRTTETISVDAVLKAYKISTSEHMLGEVSCDTDTVTVTGPDSILKDIDKGLVEINMGDEHLTESITTDGTIVLKDQNGRTIESKYIKLSKSTVRVYVPVYGYKDIALKVGTKHSYYNKNIATVSVDPEYIKVYGEPSVLQQFDYVEITTIDEKRIGSSTELIVDIDLPDNTFAVAGEPTSATVSVELKGLITRTFVVDNIKILNADDKEVKVIDKSVSVTIIGERSAVNKLKADNIILTVDFKDFDDSTGIIYAACQVKFNTEDDSIYYELGDYSVQVEVK